MRFLLMALGGLWLAGAAHAQCMELTLPDTLSYTIQVAEISLEQPVSQKFFYEAFNPNIQDELLSITMAKLSGPDVGPWRYQWCEDPESDPHAQCRPIQPWETMFSIVDTLYSDDGSLYDAEIYATTYGSADLALGLIRDFCPDEAIMHTLHLTVEPLTSLEERPGDLALAAAWPNPFNPLSHLPFWLDVPGAVRVDVYNLAGQKVATPLDGWLPAGRHEALFDGAGLPSGRYTYTVRTESSSVSAPLTLIK